MARVLVTGGAGFIGSHTVDLMLEQGHEVRVFDKLVEQVHMGAGPVFVPPEAEFIHADMSDVEALSGALDGVDKVVHLAAEVGVGQSMYEINRYVDANSGGTGILLDLLANRDHGVSKLVVASSMSNYGEGAYRCPTHEAMYPPLRTEAQLTERRWELSCPTCGTELEPTPTAEDKPLNPTSVYAITKMDQELLCLAYGAAYGMGVVALRFFNAYGPRQALSNPYTGVAAIFSGRLLHQRAPLVFEDGHQRRDLVHVSDVARSISLALDSTDAEGHAINIGAGSPMSILEVATTLARELGVDVEPEVTQRFRAGDIRHCWADTTKADELLGYRARVPFTDGVGELIEWVRHQQSVDTIDLARIELEKRGLAR